MAPAAAMAMNVRAALRATDAKATKLVPQASVMSCHVMSCAGTLEFGASSIPAVEVGASAKALAQVDVRQSLLLSVSSIRDLPHRILSPRRPLHHLRCRVTPNSSLVDLCQPDMQPCPPAMVRKLCLSAARPTNARSVHPARRCCTCRQRNTSIRKLWSKRGEEEMLPALTSQAVPTASTAGQARALVMLPNAMVANALLANPWANGLVLMSATAVASKGGVTLAEVTAATVRRGTCGTILDGLQPTRCRDVTQTIGLSLANHCRRSATHISSSTDGAPPAWHGAPSSVRLCSSPRSASDDKFGGGLACGSPPLARTL